MIPMKSLMTVMPVALADCDVRCVLDGFNKSDDAPIVHDTVIFEDYDFYVVHGIFEARETLLAAKKLGPTPTIFRSFTSFPQPESRFTILGKSNPFWRRNNRN